MCAKTGGLQASKMGSPFCAIVAILLLVCVRQSEGFVTRADYVGCFPEVLHDREFRVHAGTYDPSAMIVDICKYRCEEDHYGYAGLLRGKYCYCSDSYGRHGPADENSCVNACSGNNTENCGGQLHHAVYRLDNPLGYLSLSAPVLGHAQETYNISVTNQYNASVDYTLSVLADASSTRYIHSNVREIHQSELYFDAGDIVSSVKSTHFFTGEEVLTSAVTKVYMPVQKLNLTCPSVATQNKPFFCKMTVQEGTNMAADVSVIGSGNRVTFQMPDTSIYTVGHMGGTAGSQTTHHSKIYILQNQIFKHEGLLKTVQYDAIATGTIIFQVYRPVCSSGSTFCMKSYNCIGSTAVCQDQTDRWAITCASDQYFSFPGRTCRDRATNARIDWYFASDWNAMPVQTLELVGEYTHVISSTGLGFAVLDSSAIEVQPGDVFAFYMENTITIKHADSTVAEETYSDVGNNWGNRVPGEYQIPGSFSGSNTKHMVKAFVVRTVTTSFEYTFYNAGNVTLEAIVSNQNMLPGDQNYRAINDSVGIEVQAVIANLTFNFVSHVATNASVSFDIPAHPGSKVTYSWQFGDGHTEEVYQTRTMSHTYVSDGVYGITLFAWNDVSNMTTYGWISIQDTILDLVFEAGQVVTVQSYPTLVTWTIAYGTNVTYDIVFSDGNTYQLLHDAPPDIGVDGLHLGLSGALNHTFGDIGNYSVHLTASNAISSQSAMLYLPIQIPILDLYIEPPNPIPYDTEVTIVVTTTNGTNAVYESTFDGYPTRNLSMTLRTKTMTGVRQVPCTFTTADPYSVTVYQNGSYPDVNETAAGGYYGGIMNETAAGGYGYTNVNGSDDGYFYHNGTDGSYGYHNGTDGNYGYHNDSSAEGAAGGDYPGTTSIPMCDELYEYEVPDGHAIDGFVHIIPDDYYRTIGNYTLVVSGSNLVNFANASAVLWVDYLIENYTVEVEEFYITPGREINFTHAVYRASRFNLTADYADGFQHNLYRGVMLEPENIVLRHAWATADNYTVNLTMVNPVDNQTIQYEIIVQNAVEGLTLVTNSPVALYPNSVSVGLFEIHYDGVPLLGTDMFASYTFGDRSNITRYVIVNETTPHPTTHNYSVYGTYPITLNVSNYVSFMEFSTNLVVDQAILNMTIEPDPQFVQINTLCMVTVTVAWGTRLNLTWDFGDGTPTYTTDYKTNETNTEFHNYTTAGNFYITITAMNSVGTLIKTITDPIIIQFPVTGFMLTGRKQSLIEPPEWLVVVPFKFYHERAIPLPSNASYYIDYGDGTQSVTRPLPDHGDPALDDGDYEHMFSFDHGYSTGNVYTVTVVVFNLADNVTFTYDVDVFESITNLSKAVFAIEEDNNGTIILKAKGVGPGSIYYPLEKLVYLDVSMNRGSHVTYHWEFGDGFVQTVYNEPYIKYLYNEPGTYTIKLNASNPLNNVVIEKTIIVQRSCIDTEIWVEEPAPRNTTFNFQIYPGTIGSDACYFINFKDPMSDENYLAFLGNQAECEQTYPNSWALQPRRFVPYAASDLEAMRAPGQRLSLTFPHVFQTPGVWNVTMIAHNKVSRSESYWVSGVTRGFCKWPSVSLAPMTCVPPNCDTKFPTVRTHKRSEDLYMEADVAINCSSTKIYHFTWNVYTVDEETMQETSFDDLGDTVLYSPTELSTLVLRKRLLPYGLYKFRLNVSMDGEIGIENVTTIMVRIVKSDLVAKIAGGSFVRRKWGINITIDAIDGTYDPDVGESDKSNFTFRWFCRRLCETWPEYNDNFSMILAPFTSNCTYDTLNGADEGGCFKYDGVESAGELNATTGVEIFDTTNWYELDVVEMMVVVTKDDRMQVMRQAINVTLGDPPEIELSCVSNCKAKVNPLYPFTVKSKILKAGLAQYSYIWDIVKASPGVDPYTVPPWDPNVWQRYAKGTGRETADIFLDTGIFTAADVGMRLFMRCRAWRTGRADNYGESSLEFIINEPPVPGNCSVSPFNGTALETTFNTFCADEFQDDDKPFGYKVGYRIFPDDDWSWIYEGSTYTMRKAAYLPQGNSDKNYEIEVKVQAIDAIGSAAEVISTAVVYPPSAETMAAMMGNMTGPDGYIQQLARMGDAREMMQTLGVLVAYMNINNMYSVDAALAEQFNETEIALALLNAIADADLTDSERTQKDTLTARMDALRSENASAYQTWFDQRVQIRQEICQALSLMNFVSLSTGRLIVSGLRDMVKLPNEVNALAVEAIGTVAQKVWDLLDANKDAMEGPDLTANAKLLIEIIGRTLDAINAINEAGNLEADLEEILRATRTNLVTMTKYIGQGVMDKKVVGEPTTTISTTKMQVSTQLEYPDKLDKATLGAGSSGDINMPGMDSLIGTGNDTTSSLKYMVAAMKSNPYAGANATNTSGSADDVVEDLTPNSPVISLDFKNETGGEMKVQDLDDPFNIYINRDASKVQLTEVHNFTTAWDEKMVIHKIILPGNIGLSIKVWDWSPVPPQNVSNSTDDLTTTEFPETTTFDMETTTFDFNATNSTEELAGFDNTTFMVFVGIGRLPTVEVHDFNCTLPMDFSDLDVNDTTHPRNKYGLPDPSVCFMSNAFLNRTTKTTFYIGIKAMGANGTNATTVTVAPAADATGGSTDTAVDTYTPVGYALQTYASSCSFWDEENEVWSYDGCEVGELTTPYSTQCLCNHLTAFGGGMVVPMNTINFADSAFNKLDENPAVFSTMVAITCLYFILCIWARKADKIDEMKAGTTPLPDNDPRHKYLYEILVYTGSRKGGGTTAQVSMVFTGDEDETEPRLFWDPKRPVFERGGVDSFLMACPRPLGSLSLARVWHDNSGKSPGWAFSRIQVTDIQTGAKYFFICDRWLAVEEDDGLIDRVVPLAGKEELTQFNHLFWSQTKKNLYDGHIWFSIFTRPRRSHFTRVQRLTCVLSLLFCTMLSNIMFYKADSQSTPQVYKLGPLQFTLEGIITGVIASLIVFPINLLIVQLFRLSRPKPKKPITSTYGNDTKTGDETLSDELEKQKQFLETGDHSKRLLMTPTPKSSVGVSYIGSDKGTPAVKNATKEEDKSKKKKKKKGIRFPWWSIYIAYSVSFCSVVLSVYFCTEFAGAMGATKAEQWLGSFMISCMESVFLTQPIKIFGLAVFYALVIKSPDVDEEGDEDRDNNLKPDEEYLHEDQMTGAAKPMKPSLAPEPPDEEYIRAAREKRFKEIKTQAVIREILIYFVFTYLLFMVGYGNRDPWSFHFYENVENMISKGSFLDTDSPPQFDSILKSEDFWSWAEQTLVPAIYGIPFYDGQDYTWQNGFLADQQTYRVGAPRLRLLKTKPKMCMPPIYKYVRECRPDYSMFGEDEESYGIGWQVINTSDPNSQPDAHWTYRTSSETDGYPIIGRISTYGGGGYVAELGTDSATALSVIQELKDNLWIDRYTRGVIVEFVMWNPNINLFAISYSVVEFPQSGGAWPSYKVNVMRLDRYVGTYMFMVLGAEILVAAFIIFFLVKMIRDIRREGFKIYIKEFWNAVEFFILIVSIGAIVMYFYRLLISKMVSSEFSEDPHQFVNFQYAAYWDECYTILMGIMVFVYTVKFLKLMRFNRRMSVIGRTLKEAGKPMFVYLMAFFIIFLAYGQFAYILFGRVLLNYSTFITTLETLFSMMLNKFDFYEIDAVSPFFARIMFITFMVLVSFIVVNLFLTLIMDAFAYVSYMTSKEKNELEVVEYMVNAVKGMFGISTGKKPEPYVPSKFQYQDGGEGTVEDLDQKIESMIGKLENYLDIQATDKRVMKEMEAMKPAKRKILMA